MCVPTRRRGQRTGDAQRRKRWDRQPTATAMRRPMSATSGTPLLPLMCFNVRYGSADDGPNRWEYRKDLAAAAIRRFDPDLLGVQEALRFQADALREALPDYGFVGAGRDDGRDAGEFCAV